MTSTRTVRLQIVGDPAHIGECVRSHCASVCPIEKLEDVDWVIANQGPKQEKFSGGFNYGMMVN